MPTSPKTTQARDAKILAAVREVARIRRERAAAPTVIDLRRAIARMERLVDQSISSPRPGRRRSQSA